jgi:beta-N-acetylhexosaminidase
MARRFPLAAVLGCSGTVPSCAERDFYRDADPLGFILFARNCENPDQVRALVDSLRECVGRADAPVLIDQEGGRVARLGPPHWRAAPAMARFGELARRSSVRATEAAWLNARLIAADLHDLGITVDCAPVLDVPHAGAHDIIGDRAPGTSADIAMLVGGAFADGLLEGGVLPVIKHIPGHGRATADSHQSLPVVKTPVTELASTDFSPFRALADLPWAMTAHVLYTALDDQEPATTSRAVVEAVIRDHIGFDGVLMTDDLSMQALSGSLAERTKAALDAGCDLVLHCNGDMDEMKQVAGACRRLTAKAHERVERGEAMRRTAAPLDRNMALARLAELFEDRAA